MPNLREEIERHLAGRICFMGLGNVDYGDDGFGVRLAEEFILSGVPDVIVAGTTPDRWMGQVTGFDHIVFLDAIEFGGEPGAVVFLNSGQMAGRFPQISTHKISLGVLAQWVEASGTTKAWLLGVQAESLKPQRQLTPTLRETLEVLRDLLTHHVGTAAPGCPSERDLGSEMEVNAC